MSLGSAAGAYAGPIYLDAVQITPGNSVPAPVVAAVSPNEILLPAASVELTVTGSGFSDGATVSLSSPAGATFAAATVIVESSSKLICKIDLSGAAPGEFGLSIANMDGQTGQLDSAVLLLLRGDLNEDGFVSDADLAAFIREWRRAAAGQTDWNRRADLNGDGQCDHDDATLMLDCYSDAN